MQLATKDANLHINKCAASLCAREPFGSRQTRNCELLVGRHSAFYGSTSGNGDSRVSHDRRAGDATQRICWLNFRSTLLHAVYWWQAACCLVAFCLHTALLCGWKKQTATLQVAPSLRHNVGFWWAQSCVGSLLSVYSLTTPVGERLGALRRRLRRRQATAPLVCAFLGVLVFVIGTAWVSLGTIVSISLSFLLIERIRCLAVASRAFRDQQAFVTLMFVACIAGALLLCLIVLWDGALIDYYTCKSASACAFSAFRLQTLNFRLRKYAMFCVFNKRRIYNSCSHSH